MEMEFKDSSRRRSIVLVVGVLLAIVAGAAAFYLSSQGAPEEIAPFPTRDIVVAAINIPARKTIELADLTTRTVPADLSNQTAFTSADEVLGETTAITILQLQPITPNVLSSAQGGAVAILAPTETISPFSPIWRAVSLSVPAERAVAGLVGPGSRVDLVATIPIAVEGAIDPATGEATESDFLADQSTKLMWLDVEVLQRAAESDNYIFKMDMHQSEEVAHAQTSGASFTMLLRPSGDNRDIDRSSYGETTNRILEQYNFPIPETIDGLTYPQPSSFPSPFPNVAYITPPPSPSISPEPAVVIAPEASPTP